MQLNRSTDYAIQMLLYLAKAGKTVSSPKLAAVIGVSHRYLLQISAKLRAAGFIRAAHGPSGGLILYAFTFKKLCYSHALWMLHIQT